MIEKIAALYASGMTQAEVAVVLGTTQKVVWRAMRNHGLTARVAAKREQRGEKNGSWKGADAQYAALHLRVAVVRGKPSVCSTCGSTAAKRYEWANLSGRYDDVMDYIRECASCHSKRDGKHRNFASSRCAQG